MVVLEGSAMLSCVNNQYLPPDYLSSLPTTLDAKKSPLALLAQTCSQIGIDTPTTKLINSPTEKSGKSSVKENFRSSPTYKSKASPQSLTSEESTIHPKVCEKKCSKKNDLFRTKCSAQNCVDENTELVPSSTSCVTPNYSSTISSPAHTSTTPLTGCESPPNSYTKDSLPCGVSEELKNITNENLNISCSNIEQSNPAFRSSFPVTYNFSHLSTVFSSGYKNTSPSSYSNFVTLKTYDTGGETPACANPYCTGCQFNVHNQQIISNSVSCPSDCNQCDNQKYNLAMAMSFLPGTITSSTYTPLIRPYLCNWISGDIYCGKRFVTSEELLQHLRSHTTGVDSVSGATSSTLLNPSSLFTSTPLHQLGYANSINSLSPIRYHPYSKVSLQTLIGSSYSTFNPAMFGPYYSPYTVYSQRLGATVHP